MEPRSGGVSMTASSFWQPVRSGGPSTCPTNTGLNVNVNASVNVSVNVNATYRIHPKMFNSQRYQKNKSIKKVSPKSRRTAELYKSSHNIGNRTAAERVGSYKETEVALVYPEGFWEAVKVDDGGVSPFESNSRSRSRSPKSSPRSPFSDLSPTRSNRRTYSPYALPIKRRSHISDSSSSESSEGSSEEDSKSSLSHLHDLKVVIDKRNDAKTSLKGSQKESKDCSEEETRSKKLRRFGSKPFPKVAGGGSSGKRMPPGRSGVRPRAPRIKRTACLNAAAIVGLLYENDEPVHKKRKLDDEVSMDSDEMCELQFELDIKKAIAASKEMAKESHHKSACGSGTASKKSSSTKDKDSKNKDKDVKKDSKKDPKEQKEKKSKKSGKDKDTKNIGKKDKVISKKIKKDKKVMKVKKKVKVKKKEEPSESESSESESSEDEKQKEEDIPLWPPPKRMASLNATAILAASKEPRKVHTDRAARTMTYNKEKNKNKKEVLPPKPKLEGCSRQRAETGHWVEGLGTEELANKKIPYDPYAFHDSPVEVADVGRETPSPEIQIISVDTGRQSVSPVCIVQPSPSPDVQIIEVKAAPVQQHSYPQSQQHHQMRYIQSPRPLPVHHGPQPLPHHMQRPPIHTPQHHGPVHPPTSQMQAYPLQHQSQHQHRSQHMQPLHPHQPHQPYYQSPLPPSPQKPFMGYPPHSSPPHSQHLGPSIPAHQPLPPPGHPSQSPQIHPHGLPHHHVQVGPTGAGGPAGPLHGPPPPAHQQHGHSLQAPPTIKAPQYDDSPSMMERMPTPSQTPPAAQGGYQGPGHGYAHRSSPMGNTCTYPYPHSGVGGGSGAAGAAGPAAGTQNSHCQAFPFGSMGSVSSYHMMACHSRPFGSAFSVPTFNHHSFGYYPADGLIDAMGETTCCVPLSYHIHQQQVKVLVHNSAMPPYPTGPNPYHRPNPHPTMAPATPPPAEPPATTDIPKETKPAATITPQQGMIPDNSEANSLNIRSYPECNPRESNEASKLYKPEHVEGGDVSYKTESGPAIAGYPGNGRRSVTPPAKTEQSPSPQRTTRTSSVTHKEEKIDTQEEIKGHEELSKDRVLGADPASTPPEDTKHGVPKTDGSGTKVERPATKVDKREQSPCKPERSTSPQSPTAMPPTALPLPPPLPPAPAAEKMGETGGKSGPAEKVEDKPKKEVERPTKRSKKIEEPKTDNAKSDSTDSAAKQLEINETAMAKNGENNVQSKNGDLGIQPKDEQTCSDPSEQDTCSKESKIQSCTNNPLETSVNDACDDDDDDDKRKAKNGEVTLSRSKNGEITSSRVPAGEPCRSQCETSTKVEDSKDYEKNQPLKSQKAEDCKDTNQTKISDFTTKLKKEEAVSPKQNHVKQKPKSISANPKLKPPTIAPRQTVSPKQKRDDMVSQKQKPEELTNPPKIKVEQSTRPKREESVSPKTVPSLKHLRIETSSPKAGRSDSSSYRQLRETSTRQKREDSLSPKPRREETVSPKQKREDTSSPKHKYKDPLLTSKVPRVHVEPLDPRTALSPKLRDSASPKQRESVSPRQRRDESLSPKSRRDDKRKEEEKKTTMMELRKITPHKKVEPPYSGWHWEGNPEVKTVISMIDAPPVERKCFSAIRHDDGDLIQVRDTVLVRSGPRKKDLPYVAKVAAFWEHPNNGEMMMSVVWYYRPEHAESDRLPRHVPCEIFASKHRDETSVACIEDKCYVLNFNEYCRYKTHQKQEEQGCVPRALLVPAKDEPPPKRQRIPRLNADPETVFLCRRVYDFKLKRILKNPAAN